MHGLEAQTTAVNRIGMGRAVTHCKYVRVPGPAVFVDDNAVVYIQPSLRREFSIWQDADADNDEVRGNLFFFRCNHALDPLLAFQ